MSNTNKIQVTGKNLDEARKNAAAQLGIEIDDVMFEVLENATSGFFGINAKPCKIEAWAAEDVFADSVEENKPAAKAEKAPKAEPAPKEEPAKEAAPKKADISGADVQATEFLNKILPLMGVKGSATATIADDVVNANVAGENMGLVIGRRGETLDALQYLTGIVVNKDRKNYVKVTLDTENYRTKRAETLERLADRVADRVVRNGRSVTLEPMNPLERRIIHARLQSNVNVTTHSVGEDPVRRIVVGLAKKGDR